MTQEKITQFFENLTQATSIDSFSTVYDDEVKFKDPFNEVVGIQAVHEVFGHMYRNLDNPRFVIKEYVDKENIAYVKWEFLFTFKNENNQNAFEGVSRLEMNASGKVIRHIDYWDAAEHMYEKMPLIGTVLRYIKRKIVRS
jgi:hypothetical protein